MNDSRQFKIQIIDSFRQIDSKKWDQLILKDNCQLPNPFITHAFLSALEDSGSAIAQTGWLGQHLLLQDSENNLCAALPCYLKNHSQGEYVFDQGWADFFERAGGRYYPKLQCSVPFTPATGPRFLTGNSRYSNQYREILTNALKQLCQKHEVSSAHVTFLKKDDWRAMEPQKFLLRTDQQFHWKNNNFKDFDSFLESLSSRKRKNIRKERKTANSTKDLEIEVVKGKGISPEMWDSFYEFYTDTGSRKWGRPYLTRQFFTLIGDRMPNQIVLIMAKRQGKHIAGAINFVGDNTLYGRHWGCSEYHPGLHFEVCYYRAIEYAIENRIDRVEAGAQGEHKLARGYMPVTTHSAHWIENEGLRNAVAHYLEHEREHIEQESRILHNHGPFKKTDSAQNNALKKETK